MSMTDNRRVEQQPLIWAKNEDEGFDGAIDVNSSIFEEILLANPELSSKKIVIISIVGKTRSGKSFLLNFFARFLRYLAKISIKSTAEDIGNDGNQVTIDENIDWLKFGGEFLDDAFRWKSGTEPVTQGIQLWTEPFIIGDVAYLLMDVQGLFDSNTSAQGNAKLSALAMLCSSHIIYNVAGGNLLTDSIEQLTTFANIGALMIPSAAAVAEHQLPATDSSSSKMLLRNFFQGISIVIRDFQNPQDFAFGFVGGQEYVAYELGKAANAELKEQLGQLFTLLYGILLPYPGLTRAFDGRITDIDDTFLKVIDKSVPQIVYSAKPMLRMGSFHEISFSELGHCFKAYVEMINGGSLPNFMSIIEAQSDSSLQSAVDKALSIYAAKLLEGITRARNEEGLPSNEESIDYDFIQKLWTNEIPIDPMELDKLHESYRHIAMEMFKRATMEKSEVQIAKYGDKLEKEIDELIEVCRKMNRKDEKICVKKKRLFRLALMGLGATFGSVAISLFVPPSLGFLVPGFGIFAGVAIGYGSWCRNREKDVKRVKAQKERNDHLALMHTYNGHGNESSVG